MTVDARAIVTCSLGPVISGGVGDDYAQGVGLIKTKGSILIDDIINPAVGTPVVISYTKSGVTRTIPRSLLVLSSFADPFRRTTTVELGCKLTYLNDLSEPETLTGLDDPANAGLTEEDDRIITIPVHASTVSSTCLLRLGISGGPVLTNKFSIQEFDFSSGYVSILDGLFVSENKIGLMDGSNGSLLSSLDLGLIGTGTGPVITPERIIDIGPIGVGELPGDAVTVSYSTLRLAADLLTGTEDDVAKLSWELEVVTGSEDLIVVPVKFKDGDEFDIFTRYIPLTETRTVYDKWDRVVTRTTTKYTVGAALNTQYMVDVTFNGRGDFAAEWGRMVQEIVDKEYFYYTEPYRPALKKPENYSEVSSTLKTTTEPRMGTLQSVGVSTEQNGNVYFVGGSDIVEEIVTVTKTGKKDIFGIDYPITRTITTKKSAYGKTQRGQQYIAERKDSNDYGTLLHDALRLVDNGAEIRDFTGREAVLQSRPDSGSLTNGANSVDGSDPNNNYRSESRSEIVLASGSPLAARRTKLSMPYAPDDIFIKVSDEYTSIRSDAMQKAMSFGRVQNRLLLGNRYGMNLQLAPEDVPTRPLSVLYVQISGVTVSYLTNATNWTFDATGIICSVDALFWGAVGGEGAFWFPVTPGVTTLPPPPATVNGQINVSSVIPPYNETAIYDAKIRLLSLVSQFTYSLEVFTEVPALTLRTRLEIFDAILLVAAAGSAAVAGKNVAMARVYRLLPASAGFIASGLSAGSIKGYNIGTNAGTFVSLGNTADLLIGRAISDVQAAVFDLTGQETGLEVLIAVSADLGEFTTAGLPGSLRKDSVIESSVAAYHISGDDAILVVTYLLAAGGDSFILLGQDAAISVVIELPADPGSFVLTGEEAGNLIIRSLTPEVGSYSLAGQSINIEVSDYFSSWGNQTYGYQSLIYPDWWAD